MIRAALAAIDEIKRPVQASVIRAVFAALFLSATYGATVLVSEQAVWEDYGNPRTQAASPEARTIAVGTLSAADHEAAEGFFNVTEQNTPEEFKVNALSLSVHPQGIPIIHLRELKGKRVEVLIRVVEPRQLGRIER